jgi:hypothetical protein
LGDRGVARELRTLATHPCFQLGNERRAPFGPDGEALFGGQSVDITLNVEQEINASDGLEGNRRDRRRGPCPTRIGGDVGEHEEFAPCMAPAERLRHRSGLPVREVKPVVAGIGIGLQDAGELLQVPRRMIA